MGTYIGSRRQLQDEGWRETEQRSGEEKVKKARTKTDGVILSASSRPCSSAVELCAVVDPCVQGTFRTKTSEEYV
jgi:hypothetical protein